LAARVIKSAMRQERRANREKRIGEQDRPTYHFIQIRKVSLSRYKVSVLSRTDAAFVQRILAGKPILLPPEVQRDFYTKVARRK
jgi:hypothetical protein